MCPPRSALASAFACETAMPRSTHVANTGDSPLPDRSTSASKPVAQTIAELFAPVGPGPALPTAAPASDLPRTLFIEQLAQLIGKTETTIRTCATNAKYAHLIPRPFKLPNSRRLCWYRSCRRADHARLPGDRSPRCRTPRLQRQRLPGGRGLERRPSDRRGRSDHPPVGGRPAPVCRNTVDLGAARACDAARAQGPQAPSRGLARQHDVVLAVGEQQDDRRDRSSGVFVFRHRGTSDTIGQRYTSGYHVSVLAECAHGAIGAPRGSTQQPINCRAASPWTVSRSGRCPVARQALTSCATRLLRSRSSLDLLRTATGSAAGDPQIVHSSCAPSLSEGVANVFASASMDGISASLHAGIEGGLKHRVV